LNNKVLYGKSSRTLGQGLKEEEISGLMDERRKLMAELRSIGVIDKAKSTSKNEYVHE
jgi:hypothetical protein